jgi:hypothetical protein
MGRVKIPYYIVKAGRGFWNPTTAMKRTGFASVPCGLDGPEAWSTAATWNARWLEYRKGTTLNHYLSTLGAELLPTVPILRNRSGGAYSKETLNKDFAKIRSRVFGPAETRKMMDMRRSGAVEAMAGEVDDGALAAKMANTIDQARELQRTYLPVDPVSVARADDARRRGRHRLRQGTNQAKKSELP